MKNKTLVWGSIILSVILIVVGIYYFLTPADALPSFFPGFDPALTTIHLKHGIAAVVLGLAVAAFAWFKSAPQK